MQEFIPYKDEISQWLKVDLKYHKNKPVIRGMERISKPSKSNISGVRAKSDRL